MKLDKVLYHLLLECIAERKNSVDVSDERPLLDDLASSLTVIYREGRFFIGAVLSGRQVSLEVDKGRFSFYRRMKDLPGLIATDVQADNQHAAQAVIDQLLSDEEGYVGRCRPLRLNNRSIFKLHDVLSLILTVFFWMIGGAVGALILPTLVILAFNKVVFLAYAEYRRDLRLPMYFFYVVCAPLWYALYLGLPLMYPALFMLPFLIFYVLQSQGAEGWYWLPCGAFFGLMGVASQAFGITSGWAFSVFICALVLMVYRRIVNFNYSLFFAGICVGLVFWPDVVEVKQVVGVSVLALLLVAGFTVGVIVFLMENVQRTPVIFLYLPALMVLLVFGGATADGERLLLMFGGAVILMYAHLCLSLQEYIKSR